MSISNALSNAVSGLTANSRLAETASNNLANALTQGYGRQNVRLGANVTGGMGAGVKVQGVERALDPELTALRRAADADLATSQPQLDALIEIEKALGRTEGDDGLFERVGALETAFRSLADQPESPSRQETTIDAALALAERFNQIATSTTRLRQSADDEIARQVSEVNASLQQIAKLNRQIQIFEASGRDAAALVDLRERLIDKVAAVVPIRATQRRDGILEIRTVQGLPLADTRAQQISFTRTPVITAEMEYANGTGALGGLSLNGIDITPGGPGSQALEGGALAGQFAVRDQVAPAFMAQLDAMAANLIGRFADPAVDPTLAATDPGLFTDAGAAFDPTLQAGLAGRIAVNALVDPAQGGDAARLRDGINAATPGPLSSATQPRAYLASLIERTDASGTPGLTGDMSLANQVSEIGELLAIRRVTAEGDVAGLSATREGIAGQESRVLGVDQDAELQALIQIERAYAANTQVIQAASRMLDELLRI